MRTLRFFSVFVLILGFSGALAWGQAKIPVSIASGPSGGGYYIIGGGIATILQKYVPNLVVNSEATGGTSENLRLVNNKEATIGMGMCDDIVMAYKGERDYKGRPAVNLRAIMSAHENTFHIVVRGNSPIQKLSDLKGKKVSLGPSGAPYFGPNLLEQAVGLKKGVDYNGQYLPHDQAASALIDRDIDVMIVTIGFPGSAISSIASTHDIRFIEPSEEEVAKVLAAFPYWRRGKLPAGSYKGLNRDLTVPEVPVWLFTHHQVPEDIVYVCVKTIIERNKELGAIHPDGHKFRLDKATQGVIIPFHAGAIKYFKEKGVM